MNGYTYPPHNQQLSPQHHQSPTNQAALQGGGVGGGINPAMLQGTGAHSQGMTPAQMLARQQMMNMGGMNGGMNGGMGSMSSMPNMGNMGGLGANGAMNLSMANRMNNVAGMGGMGVNSMNGINNLNAMNNMDLFKMGGMGGTGGGGGNGAGPMNMGVDGGGMTINPAMLGAASSAQGGMSNQDLQKIMAARQASLGMASMGGMNTMNGMAGMGGMNGMNMSMNMMSGNPQQQALMQQYIAQQSAQHQHQQQQQHQSQSHSPHSATHTPGSISAGGNPYPPFPSQSQTQQIQLQGTGMNSNSMPPPPPRPSTAMSNSSQHGMNMGIVRSPSRLHQHRSHEQVMPNQQQQQQQINQGSISRPGTAVGFRPSSSAGEAPRTPRTPQISNQSFSNMQSNQVQHMRETSQTPSRPQTASSNHVAGQVGMNGKYPVGMSGIGAGGLSNMANMVNIGGMPLMGGVGGGMMPPPGLPRQGSLGPSSQPQNSMQPQPQPMQSQQQMQHHQQQQGMMSGHGHGSPISSSTPVSAGMSRAPSIEGLTGMGGIGMDDPMGNMTGMNSGLGMGSGMPNAGIGNHTSTGMGGMGIGGGGGGIGGIGVGGIGGMSQMQHMQEMQQRKAITLAEYHKQQAARLQQQQQQQQGQQQQGQQSGPNVTPVVGPSPGTSISSAGMSAGAGMAGEAQGQGSASSMPIQGAGIGMGMSAMGTPTRVNVAGRGSMPPPGSVPMSIGGVTPIPGVSSAGTVPPPASVGSGSSGPTSVNGAAAPSSTTNATAASSTAGNAQNALAASLRPLPANVQQLLNPAMSRISVIPISESAKRIPQLSSEETTKIAEWVKIDRAYEGRYREMVTRTKAELAAGPTGVNRPRWWERDANPAAVTRRPKEKFDLHYPYGTSLSREAAARRKGRRREGLKVPGRLKSADAERGEQLVPIRLEFDVEHHKYRDTFVWNLNDPIVTPEAFAQSLIDDYGLSTSYHSMITKSIQEQLSDFKAHIATFADVSNDNDISVNFSDTKAPLIRGQLGDDDADAKWWASWRGKLRTRDGRIRARALLKEMEAAAAAANSERTKKRKRAAQDRGRGVQKDNKEDTNPFPASASAPPSGRAEETKPSVVRDETMDVDGNEEDEDNMHEEMRIVVKLDITVGEMKLDDQFEWDIENADPSPEQFAEVYCSDLGLAGEFRTTIAHSIREQVSAYQKSLFLVGHPSDGSAIQDDDLRMSFCINVTSAARSIDQTQAHQPIINYLSEGELDRLDKEREKEANKRRKRNTRGRRGVTLPDREPLRTQRTPAIGFPEIDPSMLAIAAAAAAPTSRRAAAAAASVTIANMVASENGTTILPQMNSTPAVPALPVSKVPKPRGSFKAPSYPSTVLKPRANATSAVPSTVADASKFEPPLEGDAPLPASAPATPSVPASKVFQGPMNAKRQRELEKEAKEREFADGQRANMIDGVWHCSNCGCPDNVAIGRRKGPLGDKSQCGACGKFWHRHRRPRPVEYHTEPEYHLNLRMESERAKASAKKRGGAAALRALNLQKDHDQAATPASATDEPSSPPIPKAEVWVEIKSPRKSKSGRASAAPPADVNDLFDRPLSPASDVSSSGSEKPLAKSSRQANGTASASRVASAAATPAKAASELPAQPEPSTTVPESEQAPSTDVKSTTPPAKEAGSSETPSAPSMSATPSQDPSSAQGPPPPRPVRPQWQDSAMAEMQARYPDDRFDIILRKQNNGNPPEWRVKCHDCPGKLYTPGPGESLSNFEVHLKNRGHRGKVHARVAGGALAQPS